MKIQKKFGVFGIKFIFVLFCIFFLLNVLYCVWNVEKWKEGQINSKIVRILNNYTLPGNFFLKLQKIRSKLQFLPLTLLSFSNPLFLPLHPHQLTATLPTDSQNGNTNAEILQYNLIAIL